MIQMPRRSVTRFFIPLIDVLILLFCIYLLLPIVGSAGAENDGGVEGTTSVLIADERHELDRLRQQALDAGLEREAVEEERRELEHLSQEKIETLQRRLAVRVLEIDADTGKLFVYDPDRVQIDNEARASAYIDRQRRGAEGRELYFLFLFPRRVTGYPEERQINQYEHWFDHVAHAFDNSRPAGGG